MQNINLEKERVLIATSSFGDQDKSSMNKLEESGCQIINNPYKRKLKKEEIIDLLSTGVTAIIAGLEPLDKDVLYKSKLKVISRCGSGLSNVDLKAAKDLGIKVCSTPDGPTEAVAELTLAAMLGLLRMLPQMDCDLHSGQWNKRIGNQLYEKTVVIIGYGRIGKRVASLLRPFEAKIIVVDPALKKNTPGIKVCHLREALKVADIITIHCSGEQEIMGSEEFSLMKEGVFLLNAARGGLVNEEYLIKALDENKVKGAWFDVFCNEPYSGSLIRYKQVILTPHVGSYTLECRKSMEMQAVDNLITALRQIR